MKNKINVSKKDFNENKSNNNLALFMGLGVAFGIIYNQLALCMSLGTMLGLVFDYIENKKTINSEKNNE